VKRRRKKRDVAVPVASMGDIAFLLLIFFVLCSNFSQKVSVELTPPKVRELPRMQDPQLSVAISKDGRIFLHNTEVPDAEAVEWGLAALLKDRSQPEQRIIMFKCDQKIEKEVFEPVLEAIAKAGGLIAAGGDQGDPK
jgi:biopolymer transport protein ExbD